MSADAGFADYVPERPFDSPMYRGESFRIGAGECTFAQRSGVGPHKSRFVAAGLASSRSETKQART